MEEASIWLDKVLQRTIEEIVVGEGPYFEDLQWRVSSLSIRVRELCLYSAVEIIAYAFVTSRIQSLMLHDYILRGGGVNGIDFDFDKVLYDLSSAI